MKKYLKFQSIILVLVMTLTLIFKGIDMNVLAEENITTSNTEDVEEKKVVEEPKIVEELTEKRTENTKYFLKEDGSTEVAVYKEPIHYEEDGQWKEIDNTLKETTTETEDNKKIDAIGSENGDLKFNFAKDSNEEKLVSIVKEGYEISWNLEGSKKKKLEEEKKDKNKEKEQVDELIKETVDNTINNDKKYDNITEENKKEIKEVLTYNENIKTLESNSNTINYADVLDNVNLQYIQGSTSLKENLIINKKIDTEKFQFNITAKDLKAELNEDNTISFYSDNEEKKEIFLIKSPYLIDANGESTTDVKVEIKGEDGKYTLILQPDKSWMNDKNRVYPVTLDPVVSTSTDIRDIEDNSVHSRWDVANKNYYNTNPLTIGKAEKDGNDISRTFIKFKLPSEITSAEMVLKAQLNLALWSKSDGRSQINVHKVLGDWNTRNITWNNQPGYNNVIEDYAMVNGNGGTWYNWDITSIAKEWFTTGNNYGLLLKTEGDGGYYQEFISSDVTDPNVVAGRPLVQFQFINACGLESYWTYTTQDIGRAGTGYVNNYNGNLTLIHDDLSMSGNRMPISINHVFNNYERTRNIGYGNGFRLNLAQTIERKKYGNDWYYEHIDEDGTKQRYKDDGGTTLKNEVQEELTLTKNSDGTFTIKDTEDSKLNFKDGKLISVEDSNGNKMTIDYWNNKISKVTDGSGRVVTLNYNGQGLLGEIVYPDGRKNTYEYSGNSLTKITYPDGKSSSYEYEGDNRIMHATDYTGNRVRYVYYNMSTYRMSTVIANNVDGEENSRVNFEYGDNSTKITDNSGKYSCYQFDNTGKTISIRDDEGSAKYYKYGASSNKGKITEESKMQKSVLNLLGNPGAEEEKCWGFTKDGGNGSGEYTTNEKYDGNKSLKITKTDAVSRQYVQDIPTGLDKGKPYTFSAYIKTDNIVSTKNKGAGLAIYYLDKNGNYEEVTSEFITGTNDWQRIQVTFTIPADSKSNHLIVRPLVQEATGTAYFDNLQLETGEIANRYNYLANSGLNGVNASSSGLKPDFWNGGTFETGKDGLLECNDIDHPENLSKSVMKIVTNVDQVKRLMCGAGTRGKKGDAFVFSSWLKAASVSRGNILISLAFISPSGNVWSHININKDCNDWQYVTDVIKAPIDYTDIHVYAQVFNEANPVYLDGIQLFKEEFGDSYTYDSKGNVVSVKDASKEESTFKYDGNNNLIKTTTPKGTSFNYKYDDKHKLIQSNDLKVRYIRDTLGENTVNKDNTWIEIKALDEKGNNIAKGKDVISNENDAVGSKSNVVDEDLDLAKCYQTDSTNSTTISWVQVDLGKQYSIEEVKVWHWYDGRIYNNTKTEVSEDGKTWYTIFDCETEGKYSETKDGRTYKISDAVPSDTTKENDIYSIKYDKYGNPIKTSIGMGEKSISSSSSYTASGNYMSSMTDSFGNTVKYDYDENRDVLNSVTDAKGSTTNYQYDSLNRVTSVSKKVGNETISNSYTYNNDRLESITHNGFSYRFGYDKWGNNTDVSVGNQKLITNVFEDKTGKLLSSTYGNGQKITPVYDKNDNLIGRAYSGDNLGTITYSGNVEGVGNKVAVGNNSVLGTTGESKRLESLNINMSGMPNGMKIKYQTCIEGQGWQDWVYGGQESGAAGKNKKLEAVRIKLENAPDGYIVQYQVHMEDKGWNTPLCQDGEVAGLEGKGKRIEAIKINLVKVRSKSAYDNNGNIGEYRDYVSGLNYKYRYDLSNRLRKVEESTGAFTVINYDNKNNVSSTVETRNGVSYDTTYGYDEDNYINNITYNRNNKEYSQKLAYDGLNRVTTKTNIMESDTSSTVGTVTYQTKSYGQGWQGKKTNGTIVGSYGKNISLEGIKISISDLPSGTKVKYQAHCADIGWQDWVYGGALAGTDGTGKRLEAIKIQLEGAPSGYSIEYKAYVKDKGWQDWVSNGEIAGTTGESLAMEAIKIRVVKSGVSSSKNFTTKYTYEKGKAEGSGSVVYQSKGVNDSWQENKTEGALSGTVGKSKALEGIKVSLKDMPLGSRVKYRIYDKDGAWKNWVYDGALAGSEGTGNRLEAVQIELEGAPEGYSIEYRAHVADKGWLSWVGEGDTAGTTGQGKAMEALEVRLVKTGSSESTRIASMDNNGKKISYTYDANGNIETITENGKTIKYYYNELNEVVREDNQTLNKTITYSYDQGGNILNKVEYPYTTGNLGTASKTVGYTYGDSNWKDKLTAFNGKEITYDEIGNPLTYDGYKFTWEMGRQLKSIEGNNKTISYKYNDRGIRTEKTVNGVTTKYYLSGDAVTLLVIMEQIRYTIHMLVLVI